ncbi:ABC transporter substrate-binding protein [Hoeflea sp. WL0058]|uniref:ABC transporter substrate-binding protein n=1 Tax=Flavimaribacter sediminis TaxID=2865987 RepID=A0AAE2ZJR4_9HYPH|nr:ABC transporter substrate-binding protein [Flavimaribacter sediminis]MBW8636331.1 ABC transporter substrate-binding protein [Flavimaribacter sediminis]
MAEPQGVTDDKIVVGSHSDLSGPLAIWGVPATNGVRMRLEEANAAGGVHDRQIEFIVEDTAYQVPLAVRATNKLVQRDKIFAMINGTGTAQTLASMQILDKAGIPNVFPLSAAKVMFDPLSPLHFSYFVSYQDQAVGAMKYFNSQGMTKVCLQSVATEYGQEVTEGAEQGAEELGMEIVFHGTHKTTETEFAGVATSIKNSDCEFLLLGTTVKDTITLYATLRQLGWDKPVVGNMVPYTPLAAEASDGVTEGLYLVTPVMIADFDDGDQWRADFNERYREKFGEAPAVQAQMGYNAADLLVMALEAAGRDLTVEKLSAAIEDIKGYKDPFGGPDASFSAEKHFGGDSLVLVQSENKKWELRETDLPY